MGECPSCETLMKSAFCHECLYHVRGPSLWKRLWRWLGDMGRES